MSLLYSIELSLIVSRFSSNDVVVGSYSSEQYSPQAVEKDSLIPGIYIVMIRNSTKH
jgi:hypothetical protein